LIGIVPQHPFRRNGDQGWQNVAEVLRGNVQAKDMRVAE
jgi:hypothetical protein